jgi:hypothetical protein
MTGFGRGPHRHSSTRTDIPFWTSGCQNVPVALFGAFLSCLGVCFVVGAVIMAVAYWSDRRQLARLRHAARPNLGELSNGTSLPRWVLITGRTAAGPDGVLAAPIFGTTCIWYRTIVTSGSHTGKGRVDRSAGGPTISLTDGTGFVQIDLGLVLKMSSPDRIDRTREEEDLMLRRNDTAHDGSPQALLAQSGLLSGSAPPRLGGRSVNLSERTIAPEVELSVVARPRRLRHGAVVLQGRGAVSAGAPQDWIARLENDVVTTFWAAAVFPIIGLVLGALGFALAWAWST